MEKVVIKLSGSLFAYPFEVKRLASIAEALTTIFLKKNLQPIVVTGGGPLTRAYINLMRERGADESTLDEVGITFSRINALVLSSFLGELAYPSVPTNLEEVALASMQNKIILVGGLSPGQSTNATAALIAERVRARMFINATDVDGVYTSDPKLSKDAKKLDVVSVRNLLNMLVAAPMGAGKYVLLDLVSLKILERSNIPTRVVLCSPQHILDAVEGKDVGTLIKVE